MTQLPEVKVPPSPEPAPPRPPARKSRRWELIAYFFLGLCTVLGAVGYQVLAENAGWLVGFGVGVFFLEVGLLGFCLISDRSP
ncbi:MAG: hypothetical protein C4315_11495 [Chloroflexota bacterium]